MTSLGSGGGGDIGGREELKSQFSTREGTYRLASAVEFARSNRPITYVPPTNNSQPAPGTSPPVRISFVSYERSLQHLSNAEGGELTSSNRSSPESPVAINNGLNNGTEVDGAGASSYYNGNHIGENNPDVELSTARFCLNIGKELFVYPFMGIRKAVDMSKPIDKRIYKGTNPTCHDFNSLAATHDSLSLLIGFSGGQIQLVDPISKEVNKLYNEERAIDKTRVTCIRWVPGSRNLFLVSHASGHMYLYNTDHPSSGPTAPNYQVHKTGLGFTVSNCKSKTVRNPINRWSLGDGAINEFVFSPCGQFLAAVSQDGFLRIFRYESLELVGLTRSYFGGLLCVCWSPDSKYICVGGEDDLVTMWSFKERRVVARGQGHKSWVSVVAFDHITTSYGDSCEDSPEAETLECSCTSVVKCNSNSDTGVFSCDSTDTIDTLQQNSFSSSCAACQQIGKGLNHINNSSSSTSPTSSINNLPLHTCTPSNLQRHASRTSRAADSMRLSISDSNARVSTCYRIGSVGQDTQICLWDLTEDVLKQPFGKASSRSAGGRGKYFVSGSDSGCMIHSNSSKNCNSNHMPNSITKSHSDKDPDSSINNFSSSNSAASGSMSNVSSSTNIITSPTTNGTSTSSSSQQSNSLSHGLLSLRFGFGDKNKDKEHKRNFSLGSSSKDKNGSSSSTKNSSNTVSPSAAGLAALGLNLDPADPVKLIGTQACPRLDECPLLEPLICKKISHERLTTLIFRDESIITACQDGILCTWARPGDAVSQL